MGNGVKFWLTLTVFYLHITTARCALKLYVDRLLGECPEFKNSVVKHLNVKMQHTANKDLNVTYTVKVSRKITERLRLEVEVTRCQSKEAPDTCVVFLNLKTTKICKMMESTNEFYSSFIGGCLTPKPKCPIDKGIYRGQNCTFNMALYNLYPLIYGYYWKIKEFFLNDKTDEIIYCSIIEGVARRV